MTKEKWVLFRMDRWPVVGRWVRQDMNRFGSEGARPPEIKQPDGQAVSSGNKVKAKP